jgi:hypothetical protein
VVEGPAVAEVSAEEAAGLLASQDPPVVPHTGFGGSMGLSGERTPPPPLPPVKGPPFEYKSWSLTAFQLDKCLQKIKGSEDGATAPRIRGPDRSEQFSRRK